MKYLVMFFSMVVLCGIAIGMDAGDGLAFEPFDSDPGWDGQNNRPSTPPRGIEQDFGYAPDDGGKIGGLVTPAGEAAFYAMPLELLSFDNPFSASGRLVVEPGGGNTLFGFFNAATVNEWRTPNSLVFRINGRGDTFHAHIEYGTSKWRAGAGIVGQYDKVADRMHPLEIPSQGVHTWSLSYDPRGNKGDGTIRATFDEYESTCNLNEGHKLDNASFNRFGILNVVKSADGSGRIWLSDLTVNGQPQSLANDPQWEGKRNRISYDSNEVRARFDFGFSSTSYAGGRSGGEMGGLFFRGDCRYPEKLAYYGAQLEPLSARKPLRASGRLVLCRGVSDSTTLFGFFHSRRSVEVNDSQRYGTPSHFLGLAIEGPSAQGFYVYPVYRFEGDAQSGGIAAGAPRIYPDGAAHEWTLEYIPSGAAGEGSLSLSMDGTAATIPVPGEGAVDGEAFDRFGLVTPWIDGNGQVAYFDDLHYTVRQP